MLLQPSQPSQPQKALHQGPNPGFFDDPTSPPQRHHTLPALGIPIPDTPHAVSVALPTWQDCVGYEEGDRRVVDALQTGYPRFVFHDDVKKLFDFCTRKFGRPDESCLVFPSRRPAEECRDFMLSHLSPVPAPKPSIRLAELTLAPRHNPTSPVADDPATALTPTVQLHAILLPSTLASLAKQFWQHSGEGISSRFAAHALHVLDANARSGEFAESLWTGVRAGPGLNPHYAGPAYRPRAQVAALAAAHEAGVRREQEQFVEERFGRNWDVREAVRAKRALRRRIAGVLGDAASLAGPAEDGPPPPTVAAAADVEPVLSDRGVVGVSEGDVFLFPSGMSAIYNAHRVVRKMFPDRKSVQFGFPYIDTLKIQEKIGPGCHFLGLGDASDLSRLERDILPLAPISAVFCEFPSNPLLRTPDLRRLRALADEYGFLLVVDETVGNFVNVAALQWADVVVSSLTKIFSGDSNVMGGSMVLNPGAGKYAETLVTVTKLYHENLWCEDAIFLERNSRTFRRRIAKINDNAERLCDFLRARPEVESVHYPKYTDADLYRQHARAPPKPSTPPRIGYGGLFSLILHTDAAAERFYDALAVAKGPSLGTNFTLACPYTILAHYGELDWAAGFGVPRRLVRVSVGLEDGEELVRVFGEALDAATG
ncbi:cystathionine gamma-synthase [Blyttiomyces helicus]|uniref:Cystathionine gamma-synthase n=1 Tax=Blyttiomyces helicus TaxID=388810 RepID=A0A4P9WIL3_9FUNG|nr:cystathionine gamma-synthase [Blyttiomyces helicus]|eukprot:RKO92711.1 cystathionine gamma-synthase [Blyttiomyces helicus]